MSTVRPTFTSPAALARLVPPDGFVLVETDPCQGQAARALRALAVDVAAAARARVLLYDGSGLPPWTGDGRPARAVPAGRVLRSWELEPLGRAWLLPQIGGCVSRGVHAVAWLSSAPGPAGIDVAVRRTGASLVLLRTEPESPPADPRVLRLTAAWYASRIRVPVVVLERGGPRLVEPLVDSARPAPRRHAGVPAVAAALP